MQFDLSISPVTVWSNLMLSYATWTIKPRVAVLAVLICVASPSFIHFHLKKEFVIRFVPSSFSRAAYLTQLNIGCPCRLLALLIGQCRLETYLHCTDLSWFPLMVFRLFWVHFHRAAYWPQQNICYPGAFLKIVGLLYWTMLIGNLYSQYWSGLPPPLLFILAWKKNSVFGFFWVNFHMSHITAAKHWLPSGILESCGLVLIGQCCLETYIHSTDLDCLSLHNSFLLGKEFSLWFSWVDFHVSSIDHSKTLAALGHSCKLWTCT